MKKVLKKRGKTSENKRRRIERLNSENVILSSFESWLFSHIKNSKNFISHHMCICFCTSFEDVLKNVKQLKMPHNQSIIELMISKLHKVSANDIMTFTFLLHVVHESCINVFAQDWIKVGNTFVSYESKKKSKLMRSLQSNISGSVGLMNQTSQVIKNCF